MVGGCSCWSHGRSSSETTLESSVDATTTKSHCFPSRVPHQCHSAHRSNQVCPRSRSKYWNNRSRSPWSTNLKPEMLEIPSLYIHQHGLGGSGI
jgi:hypothetical protein